MSYVVLARKWRPSRFEEVVGQEHVGRTLKNALEQDRVAHAYLFCGTRGIGKTTTARILAKALNCKKSDGPTPEPCDECVSCVEIREGQSVDVFEIDGASNRGINEIRELREGVRYAPSRDRNKIYIIDEVHMLTTEAFNALLKTLEEPPEHAHFIFATTEPQKIPVTILSRCQRFDFKRISQHEIVEHLERLCGEEGIEAERAALQLIARQANGGMRDALSLMDQIISFAGESFDEEQVAQILGVANRKHLFELSEALLSGDADAALSVLDEVDRYGYDLQQFASEMVTHLRDLVVVRVSEEPERVTQLTESEIATAAEQVGERDVNLLHRYFSVMADGAKEMTRSPYPKLLFEMTLVRMAELEPLVGLDLLVDRLESLEGVLDEDLDLDAVTGGGSGPDDEATGAKKKSAPSAKLTESSAPEALAHDSDTAPPQTEEADAAPASDPPEPQVIPPEEPTPTAFDGGATESPDEPAVQVGEAAPDAPQEVAPQDEIETPDPGELLRFEPRERWRAVVEHVRETAAPVAATLEHANLLKFEDDEVVITFSPGYFDLFAEGERAAIAEAAIRELFGAEWTLHSEVKENGEEDQTNGELTLAEEREADIEARREQLEEEVAHHPVVERARQMFEPEKERTRVELFEE